MVRKGLCKKAWTKVGAVLMSAAIVMANVTMVMPQTVVYAETTDNSSESASGTSEEGSTDGSSDASSEVSSVDDEKEETVTVKTEEVTEEAATTLAGTEEATSLTAATAGATLLGAAASGNASSGAASASSSAASEASSEGTAATSASSVEGSAASSASSVEAATAASSAATEEIEEESEDRNFDDSKTDVWDFGAEDLGEDYNNRLTVDTINGLYSVSAGSTGVNIASFSIDDGDFSFNDGGYSETHRLRTTNTELTRYDSKSLKDSDGNVYSGYIYSNKSGTSDVYIAVECQADDIITAYVASNGTDSDVVFENMSDGTESTTYTHTAGSSTVSRFVYYPANESRYKLYSATEKLVVARILRKHAEYAQLTGTVNGYEGTESLSIVFTNRQNGNEVRAEVSEGSFTAELAEGFDYDLSLEGADNYVITSSKSINISEDTSIEVDVAGVTLVTYTGSITGIDTEDIDSFVRAAEFTFTPDDKESVYVPSITLNSEENAIVYEVKLQSGVNYEVAVEDKEDTASEKYAAVEDYNLITTSIAVDGEKDNFAIEFEAKPVYNITIVPNGATLDDLAEATFTFTRLDTENDYEADGYVYEFTGTDGITLRDGQYVVEVTDSGEYVQQLTSNLIVNGADVVKEITFSSDITEWNFSDESFVSKYANASSGTYNGLSWTNGRSHNSVYLYSGAGTISVPVKGACQIQVTANYQYSFYFESDSEESVDVKTGTTSQDDTFTYNYDGEKGTFDITVLGSSYITKIATVYQTEYKSEISVGSSESADYETIGEALDAIRLMERDDSERVTVSIEPGNYEEMLVIDVPNVTLKNASDNPTNTLTNSGVDIDDNAVRITWYYGHGYTYYSMGSDYKYNSDVLTTNKANGYASVVNPGSGTGTYWNATVVVSASGFEAKDIIFENSFNQYMSEKAAEDVIVPQSGAKEGSTARADMLAGDTSLQNKSYVERAAALALTSSATESYFDGCRIIGRQDTLYGGEGATAAFYDCAVYGGTDYIFGGMTAVFAKCDLVLNTSEDKNDVAYITAAQQKASGTRGYLMYNCKVTSATPGVDTASEYKSKPGQFGRPWQANTSEVVFFDTVVEATNWSLDSNNRYVYDTDSNVSLIQPAGWNTTLGGESARCVEYGTYEVSGEDNSSSRVTWAQQPETAVCSDGTGISVAAFLGDWDPFEENGNDMTITFPDGTTDEAPVADESEKSEEKANTVYTLESSGLAAFAAGAKSDGETEKAGTDEYFTLVYSAKSKVDSSSKTWDDGYASSQRLNLGGNVSTEKNAIKFTTSSNEAQVEVWWACGDSGRQIAILDSNGSTVAITEEEAVKNSAYKSTLKTSSAGTYYLGGATGNNYIFKVVVTDGEQEEVIRADWSSVSTPVIESVALNESDSNKIDVKVNAIIGTDGGDSLTVTMYDEGGITKETLKSSAEKESFDFSFTPELSGKYYFVATLAREDETDVKTSGESDKYEFTLPLTAPQFKNAVNKGSGTVTVKFYSVKEATEYTLLAIDTENESSEVKATYTPEEVVTNTSTEYEYTFKNLTVGHEYKLVLSAKRNEEVSAESTMNIEVTEDGEQEWTFSAFGSGVSTSTNKATVNDDGSVTVASTGGKGKLVPASTDGLAFYYATIPADKNFTLSATVSVDSWKYSNGQEGFGLMAADTVGVNGDSSAFWNNSYMASATKVEYYYDTAAGEVTDDTSASKISMKIGIGSQQKIGVTQDNLSLLQANDSTTITGEFSSTMRPLDTSCGSKGAGTYNLIGNETSGGVASTTVDNPVTEFKLSIRKNNTGYFVSYTDADGNTTTQKYYDTEALEQLDTDNVYAGFFASRNATATFSDIELTLVDPADDEAAEDKPITYVTPSYKIISATYSNTAEYTLQYTGNADGVLTISDSKGNNLVNAKTVEENTVESVEATLDKGDNTFTVTFIPDEFFHPEDDEYQLLSSYEASTFTHTVNYKTISDAKEIYVSPEGTSTGEGTENSPVDIYTAVKYVQPGQTIRLAGGTYSLKSTVTVARGIDGTSSKPIRMIAESGDRAVFDFNKACAGFVFAGDYWYVSGIDCTRSGNSQKGIQVSGSHITLEDIHTYENGNTGIQVSRYLSTDEWDDWPSDDLILNCTSYSNADAGYEDADGFAAKLTVAEGIVFDGCISYNNADDGWDLFAKVESGCIGQVTIRNCVAFANGYGVDGTDEGNGNGFKMGGSSMAGPHKLINSVAWGNKAKGIDSNSGPDIQVYNSMSFNNGGSNVALYTNDTANTDFCVDGVLSYRTTGTSTNETIKAKGTQDSSKIYGKLNFFWNDGTSANSEGLTASDDWFVSLDAPYANAQDPLAVAEGMRSSNGKIDLGDFLKLTDAGMEALAKAGITYSDVVAVLNGSYEASGYNYDPSEDDDSSSASSTEASSEESPESSTEVSSDAGSSASTQESGSASSTEEAGSASTSGSSTQDQSSESSTAETSSDSTSESDSASEGSGDSSDSSDEDVDDDESGSDESGSSSTSESVPASRVEPTPIVRAIENVVERIVNRVNNFVNRIFGNDNRNNERDVAGAQREENIGTQDNEGNTQEHSNEAVQTPDDSGKQTSSGVEILDEQTAKEAAPSGDKTPIPVAPIAAGGATVVVAAAAVVAVKTGLMAKLLALLHIIK